MNDPLLKGVSLKGLEVFETLAQTGSIAATAHALGLSRPAVSQQVKNLDAALGVDLIDHSTRPMKLTSAGRQFLRRVEVALAALRAGRRDFTALDLSELPALRLGIIEDFENEVTPILTERLAETMQNCAFRLQTSASHVLLGMLEQRELDMAISAAASAVPKSTTIYPLASDPYVLAVPRGADVSAGITGLLSLPFIRRDRSQIMAEQIDTYLAQIGVQPSQRFELDSNQSISALVASGVGWTITTHQSLLRAGRFSGGIDVHDLPGTSIAREIVLYAASDWAGDLPGRIADLMRELILSHVIDRSNDANSSLTQTLQILR